MKIQQAFPPFWWEGNLAFRAVTNSIQLEELEQLHVGEWRVSRKDVVQGLANSRRNERSGRAPPQVGPYAEHSGSETLGEFLALHGIELE